jgi:23S rRNA (cytosine1962-C5)-methyltransferase
MAKLIAIPRIHLLTSPDWQDYELLDSGAGQKLERYGPYRLVRPEPEAIWDPALPEKDWKAAQAVFIPSPEENGGHWQLMAKIPERWQMQYRDLRFWASLSASRHVGVFPEQACQWDWIIDQIQQAKRPISVLNLFGYTGLASLAAARAGARVTHLDASKKVVTWARDNQQISRLDDTSIRWIIDDALKFVQREERRGTKYDGLILDPPKFGRGPKGEVWEFYKLLPNLLQSCSNLLSANPQFLLITAYAVKASALTLHYAVDEIFNHQGNLQAGEVALQEKSANRIISMAIYARWSASEILTKPERDPK